MTETTTDTTATVSEGFARLGVGVIGLGAFAYYTWDATTMPMGQSSMPGPGLFPVIVGVFGLVFSLVVVIDALPKIRQGTQISLPSGRTAKNVAGVMFLLVLFVFGVDLVGAYIASMLFCLLSIKLLSGLPWWKSALYGAAMGFACIFIFDSLLNVSLPRFMLW
ncbi:MAG: tripartite tricarboxylate transporter TctB family protein [Micrococcaceae bacterium]